MKPPTHIKIAAATVVLLLIIGGCTGGKHGNSRTGTGSEAGLDTSQGKASPDTLVDSGDGQSAIPEPVAESAADMCCDTVEVGDGETPPAPIDTAGLSHLIPAGYLLVEKITGDLNRDGLEDVVLLIRNTDKENIFDCNSCYSEDGEKSDSDKCGWCYYERWNDTNPWGIIIAFKKGGHYRRVLENRSFFPAELWPGGTHQPPDKPYVSIKDGNLLIEYTSGTALMYTDVSYNFQYRNSDFELIGYDCASNRTGNVYFEESINFLTKRIFIKKVPEDVKYSWEELNDGKVELEETWRDIAPKKTIKLREITDLLYFDPNKTVKVLGLSTLTWDCGPEDRPGAVKATLKNGVLRISGKGAMRDYDEFNFPPWYNKVNKLVIEKGVTSIGDLACYQCSTLTSAMIPGSVTAIGREAFSKCFGLTSLTISNGVKSIGERAFQGCISLTSVTIPRSVTSIEVCAFAGCWSLTSITIPNGVTLIEDGVFTQTGLKSVTIPNSVTSIGMEAFSNCTSLTSITIPGSVTDIKYWAFLYTGLTSIIVRNPIPPHTGNSNAFPSVDMNRACLYVPKGSIDAYRAAEGWKDFKCVKALESAPGGE